MREAILALKLAAPDQILSAQAKAKALAETGSEVPSLARLLAEAGVIKPADVQRISDFRLVHYYATRIPGFKVVSIIGHGSSGTVFKAKQVSLDRWVAIKVLRHDLAEDDSIRARFLTEAKASARFTHPNIVGCIEFGQVGGTSFMVMEYVDGRTVSELVRERGPLDERIALGVVKDVAMALQHADRQGVVHRDIKPDNIMLGRDRQTKLLDLGLALGGDGDSLGSGVAVGTPNYMSPEQALGEEKIDSRADIYSLGASLHYMLTGRSPYTGTPEQVMFRHVNAPVPDPTSVRPDLRPPAVGLMRRMMAKQRDDRPRNPDMLLVEVDAALRGLGGQGAPMAPPPPVIGKTAPPPPAIGQAPLQRPPMRIPGTRPPEPEVTEGGVRLPRKRRPARRKW